MTDFASQSSPPLPAADGPPVPAYLRERYAWAYLHPGALRLFDHPLIVSGILWGNYGRLKRAAFAEIAAGRRVLQPACVYGDFSRDLAAWIGERGSLDVTDIAPIQVANCRRKLAHLPYVRVRRADAAVPGGGPYDVVCCFFLVHEIPDRYKGAVVDGLLRAVAPGGKVVFVDYHRPHALHPLRRVMSFVFDTLEPFARTLWSREIEDFARAGAGFAWRKQTYFGGLYQKVVAEARGGSGRDAPDTGEAGKGNWSG